jgi:putative ABC transport system substrate-binding protein
MASYIGRRKFLATLLGGAAAAWSLAARAQQAAMPVVGFLSTRSPQDAAHLVTAFHRGLSESGFVDGQNLTIDFRWAEGQYDRLPALAAGLVCRPVKVIAATGGEPAPLAAKAATATIPIVFAVGGDPVRSGLVASYGRPGGNITGVSILTRTLEAKRIGLVREVVPRAATIGFLMNPTFPAVEAQLADIQEAVRNHGIQLQLLRASTDQAIDAAFETVARERIPALVIGADPFFDTRRAKLATLAAKQAVPTMFHLREYAEAGGLMSYGIDLPDVYRQVGAYVGRILKGAKPADLPVLQPTKFELMINLKTAKALGLSIPPDVLSLADGLIE